MTCRAHWAGHPLARQLREEGAGRIDAIRIDSGDLAGQARLARATLDQAGCQDIRVAVSGDLDEYAIAGLVRQQAPIDIFGVGTRMSTSADAPFLDCAYKLAEYDGRGRRKRSPGKHTYPGAKQVFRCFGDEGAIVHDTIGLDTEDVRGRPLLQPVLLGGGRRTCPRWSLAHMRQELRSSLACLPPRLLSLERAPAPPVMVSAGLAQLTELVDRQLG